MNKYEEWIRNFVKSPYGQCRFYCEKMILEFPELKMVRGHYLDGDYKHSHWWLIDPNGFLVIVNLLNYQMTIWMVGVYCGTAVRSVE